MPLSVIDQLLVAIYFYAHAGSYTSTADVFNISPISAFRYISKISYALPKLYSKYIRFPKTEQDMIKVEAGFFRVSKFPRVIGVIDGTHIRVGGGESA